MTYNENLFISEIIQGCIEYGISLHLQNKEIIYDTSTESYCEGYFDDNNKTVVIASKQDTRSFIFTLSHEFCHIKQWQENYKPFLTINPSIDIMNEYMLGRIKRTKKVDRAIDKVQKLELDCEKRNVKLLRSHVHYKKEDCIKRANAYIYFYSVLKETGKWYTTSPDKSAMIMSTMPINFVNNYDLTPELLDLYQKHCYSVNLH